jgi:hypothetical protein
VINVTYKLRKIYINLLYYDYLILEEDKMKKIITTCIVVMFLLMGFTTISAVGMNIDVSERTSDLKQVNANNEDLPDFYVVGINYEPRMNPTIIEIWINNSGNFIPETELTIRAWFDGYPDSTREWKENYREEGKMLFIGAEFYKPGNKIIYKLIVLIDPDNEIPEIDKTNNREEKNIIFMVPKIKSIDTNNYNTRELYGKVFNRFGLSCSVANINIFKVISKKNIEKVKLTTTESTSNIIKSINNGLPDFTELNFIFMWFYNGKWMTLIELVNRGSPISNPEDLKVPVKIWLEGYPETEMIIETDFSEEAYEFNGIQAWGALRDIYKPANAKLYWLRGIIDPDNTILESDDNNNDAKELVFCYKSKNKFIAHTFLQTILQRLNNILNPNIS